MNSNDTVGRPRVSRSAIRTARSLPECSRIADATRELDGVEVFEQRQHGTAAGTEAVAQLSHAHGPCARDQLLHRYDSPLIRVPRERDVVAQTLQVSALRQSTNDLRRDAGGPHRLCERRRSKRLCSQKLEEEASGAAGGLVGDLVAKRLRPAVS